MTSTDMWKENEHVEDDGSNTTSSSGQNDNTTDSTVYTGCRRPQILEGNRQPNDGGQKENPYLVVCSYTGTETTSTKHH